MDSTPMSPTTYQILRYLTQEDLTLAEIEPNLNQYLRHVMKCPIPGDCEFENPPFQAPNGEDLEEMNATNPTNHRAHTRIPSSLLTPHLTVPIMNKAILERILLRVASNPDQPMDLLLKFLRPPGSEKNLCLLNLGSDLRNDFFALFPYHDYPEDSNCYDFNVNIILTFLLEKSRPHRVVFCHQMSRKEQLDLINRAVLSCLGIDSITLLIAYMDLFDSVIHLASEKENPFAGIENTKAATTTVGMMSMMKKSGSPNEVTQPQTISLMKFDFHLNSINTSNNNHKIQPKQDQPESPTRTTTVTAEPTTKPETTTIFSTFPESSSPSSASLTTTTAPSVNPFGTTTSANPFGSKVESTKPFWTTTQSNNPFNNIDKGQPSNPFSNMLQTNPLTFGTELAVSPNPFQPPVAETTMPSLSSSSNPFVSLFATTPNPFSTSPNTLATGTITPSSNLPSSNSTNTSNPFKSAPSDHTTNTGNIFQNPLAPPKTHNSVTTNSLS
jgi:hypothetical protein